MSEGFGFGLIGAFAIAAVCLGLVAKVSLDKSNEREANLRSKEQAETLQRLLEWGFEIFERHEAALKIRLQQVLYKDPYGNWILKPAFKEIDYFVENVLLMEAPELKTVETIDQGLSRRFAAAEYWSFSFSPIIFEVTADLDAGLVPTTLPMSNNGVQYERTVAGKLAALGFSIQFTPRTGDQGVDVLAVRGDQRLAIQCKDYQGSVGNDAIQQVYAGARFHEMNDAIVVSPAKYTPAALAAGQRLGVKCLHHDELERHYANP